MLRLKCVGVMTSTFYGRLTSLVIRLALCGFLLVFVPLTSTRYLELRSTLLSLKCTRVTSRDLALIMGAKGNITFSQHSRGWQPERDVFWTVKLNRYSQSTGDVRVLCTFTVDMYKTVLVTKLWGQKIGSDATGWKLGERSSFAPWLPCPSTQGNQESALLLFVGQREEYV